MTSSSRWRVASCSCSSVTPAPTRSIRLPIRVVTEYAWHSLFARNLFIADGAGRTHRGRRLPRPSRLSPSSIPRASRRSPLATAPASDVVIALNFARRLVLIAGTSYAGEIKKSIFSVLNYLLPLKRVLSMHCSANIGTRG